MYWQTARRKIALDRPLVMGILNVTPDSFSDGGRFASVDAAVLRAEQMIADGADIIDVGGESTRPGSSRIHANVEISRVVPLIEEICSRYHVPVSVDTTKALVAEAAIIAGAEIINDISGLRWEMALAGVAARNGAGLVLMHSRGAFEEMHSLSPVENVIDNLTHDLRESITTAKENGVTDEQIVLDPGIGFGKSFEQNVELLAKLDEIAKTFAIYPVTVGSSRKSFISKMTGPTAADERLGASIATAIIAVQKGARILRVHDVKETVQAIKAITVIERE